MKSSIVFVSFLMLASLAQAQSKAVTTGPQALSKDAVSLARALTNPCVAKQVAEFSANVDLIETGVVTEFEDFTQYTLDGKKFHYNDQGSSDIVCGRSTLTITRTMTRSGNGWGMKSSFTAAVETDNSRCKKSSKE